MNPKVNKEFWVTNISDRDVALHDLGVIVRARTSINLLNSRHYNITVPQVMESAEKGSLFSRRKAVIIRKSPPTINTLTFKMAVDHNAVIPDRTRSIYEIKQEQYDELIVSDEEFAEENAETVEMDKQPPIKGK